MASKMIIGIFNDYSMAGKVVEALKEAGFQARNVSILANDAEEARFAASNLEGPGPDKVVTTCGVLGAVGGWLVGLTAMAIPGAGFFLAAGPLMSALSGAAAGGIIGVITGALIHFDVPESEAKIYAGNLSEGKILVAVHTDNKDERLKCEDIFEQFEALEIDARSDELLAAK